MKASQIRSILGAVLVCSLMFFINCSLLSRKSVAPSYSHLKELSWIIGEWTDTKEGKKTTTVCRWALDKSFITRTFEVTENGKTLNKGTEIIGWDPVDMQYRSWTFDHQGGFASSIWGKEHDKWKPIVIEDVSPLDLDERAKLYTRLDWMVGTWVDDGEENRVEMTTKWVGDKAFLLTNFVVNNEGKPDQKGVVLIGWDKDKKNIRSWMFDTDGGFAEGKGSTKEGGWQMKNRHVLPGGRLASSVAVYKKIDNNKFTWRRLAQEVGGELLPDTKEITVIRQVTDEKSKVEVQ